MMRLASISAFLLLAAAPVFSRPPQFHTVSVPIADASAHASPLAVSGWVAFQVTNSKTTVAVGETLRLTLTNVSKKTILAYVLRLQASSGFAPGLTTTFTSDDFFKSTPIQPGAHDSIHINPPQTERFLSSEAAAFSRPKAVASIAYAEFSDGAKFGDAKFAAALHRDRTAAIDCLQILLAAYQSGGSGVFRDALARQFASPTNPPSLAPLIQRIAHTMRSRGTPAAIAQIRADLVLASRRASLL